MASPATFLTAAYERISSPNTLSALHHLLRSATAGLSVAQALLRGKMRASARSGDETQCNIDRPYFETMHS
jgi:hypothetical protein